MSLGPFYVGLFPGNFCSACRRLVMLAVALAACVALCGCDEEEMGYADDPYGNFDALWHIIDTRYCYLDEKGIDWESIRGEYRARVTPKTTDGQLFSLCAAMLDELRDGHVNLVAPFNTSYYSKWWTDYPQDFNKRTLEEYYIGFDCPRTSGIYYTMMPDSIGYMYYPSFSAGIGALNLDYILYSFREAKGLIIDIRDNGGGLLTNVTTLVSRFIDHPVTGGYIRHKTGPGHNDFSEPYEYRYEPCDPRRVSLTDMPIAVLTNRSCFSAANDFVAVMKSLPQVTVIGARTGGGGGLPFSSELPNGWSVRFSASPVSDPYGLPTEDGIDPDEGFVVSSPDDELIAGRDRILDTALSFLRSQSQPNPNKSR